MSQVSIQNQSLQSSAPSVGMVAGKKGAGIKEIFATYGALFASAATLFCCALPALLVLLGFGLTSVLTFFTAIPGWETAGQYTITMFVIGGAVLALGFYFAYRRQRAVEGEVCEIPEGGTESACSTATRWNRRILWFSLFLYTLALVMDVWGIMWMKEHGYFNH
jgi:ABC-type arginine transport system permease subunit